MKSPASRPALPAGLAKSKPCSSEKGRVAGVSEAFDEGKVSQKADKALPSKE